MNRWLRRAAGAMAAIVAGAVLVSLPASPALAGAPMGVDPDAYGCYPAETPPGMYWIAPRNGASYGIHLRYNAGCNAYWTRYTNDQYAFPEGMGGYAMKIYIQRETAPPYNPTGFSLANQYTKVTQIGSGFFQVWTPVVVNGGNDRHRGCLQFGLWNNGNFTSESPLDCTPWHSAY